jgi:hypothetical protein
VTGALASLCFGTPDGLRGAAAGFNGGRTRARTWDPLIKSQLLYQLSYAPGCENPKTLGLPAWHHHVSFATTRRYHWRKGRPTAPPRRVYHRRLVGSTRGD